MNDFWLDVMAGGSPEAFDLVERYESSRATDFQFKWDVARSIAGRAIAGRLRHLPSQESVPVFIKLPV